MQKVTIDIKDNFNYIHVIAQKEQCEKFSCRAYKNKLAFFSDDESFLKLKVSEVLTEYIINFEEEKLLKNLIFSDYPFFNSSEKFSIFNTATKLIKNHDNDFLRMLILLMMEMRNQLSKDLVL